MAHGNRFGHGGGNSDFLVWIKAAVERMDRRIVILERKADQNERRWEQNERRWEQNERRWQANHALLRHMLEEIRDLKKNR